MGIIVSFSYILILLILSKILPFAKEEYSRKFVHILSSNWWFICIKFFDNIYEPLFITCSFLIVNIINYKYPIFISIKRTENNSLGEIFYSIGFIILVLISYTIGDLKIGLLGSLVMGYADGLAAIIGTSFPYKKFYNNKTLSGCITFFCVTAIIYRFITLTAQINLAYIIEIILVSLMLTLIEFMSNKGIDNIFIPIFSAIFYMLLV
ncbi:hypothetical protein AN641_03100 [Candidatus Epulonipiscioides gigas]|nr:hypothetical protein AN641_03100 [Epulopiscium sp. SCG-C07WGA-EpuloA2]